MAHYVAYDARSAFKAPGTIYGTGRSADEALSDALHWSQHDGMSVAKATDELIGLVENEGGDVRWFLDAHGVGQAAA